MTSSEFFDAFVAELDDCKSLRQYAADEIDNAEVRSITFESSLSRAFRAYENFTERLFLAYMTGEPMVSGQTVKRFVNPSNREHARSMLQGQAKFLEWARPEIVQARSKYFLDEEGPMSTAVIQSISKLQSMRKIRNHIAHNSVESEAQYRTAVQTIMSIEPQPLPRAGEFLQIRPQRGLYKGREILSALFSDLESFAKQAAGVGA